MDDPVPLVYLADYVLRPQRLASIRSLRLDAKYNNGPDHFGAGTDVPAYFRTWHRFWDVVAFDMRLTDLDLRLVFGGRIEDCIMEHKLMRAISRVKGLKKVRVDVSMFWPGKQVEGVGREWVGIWKRP